MHTHQFHLDTDHPRNHCGMCSDTCQPSLHRYHVRTADLCIHLHLSRSLHLWNLQNNWENKFLHMYILSQIVTIHYIKQRITYLQLEKPTSVTKKNYALAPRGGRIKYVKRNLIITRTLWPWKLSCFIRKFHWFFANVNARSKKNNET